MIHKIFHNDDVWNSWGSCRTELMIEEVLRNGASHRVGALLFGNSVLVGIWMVCVTSQVSRIFQLLGLLNKLLHRPDKELKHWSECKHFWRIPKQLICLSKLAWFKHTCMYIIFDWMMCSACCILHMIDIVVWESTKWKILQENYRNSTSCL